MANPTLSYASPFDVFVPEVTGEVVAYLRRQDDFPLNKYVQYKPTKAIVGLYVQMGRDQGVRVVTTEEFAWEDGDPAPHGESNKTPFQVQDFRCFRKAYPWIVGYMTIDQATLWKPKLVYMQSALTQCLTDRTNRTAKILQTAANWGSHSASVATLTGQSFTWQQASDDPNNGAYNLILKSLQTAARNVHLDTNGAVKFKDLRVVVGPDLALAAAQSAEMVNYCRESKDALMLVKEGFDPQYNLWGLPQQFKGFNFVVEDTMFVPDRVQVSTLTTTAPLQPPESPNRQYCFLPTSAVMMARPGGIDGDIGAPSFSTIQIYHYKGLAEVQVFDEPKNERIFGRVKETIAIVLAANMSGFQITQTL